MNALDRKEHLVQMVVCLLGVLAICIAVLVASTSTAKAHHEQGHNVLVLGQLVYATRLYACDTLDQMLEIINAHKNHGIEAAKEVWDKYRNMPNELGHRTCGFISMTILPTEKHLDTTLVFSSGEERIVVFTAVVPAGLKLIAMARNHELLTEQELTSHDI
ncbi:MAG: hypothetical protein O7H40_13910 [Gammaproteobacteria bacterium]|nr:hypothetical protein [Gammaproteobacteria bacterium]